MESRIIEFIFYLFASSIALGCLYCFPSCFSKRVNTALKKTGRLIIVLLSIISLPGQFFFSEYMKIQAGMAGTDEVSLYLWFAGLITSGFSIFAVKEANRSRSKKETNKQFIARIMAPLLAMLTLFTCFLGPLLLVFLIMGIPFSGRGPSWGVWILIIGGGIGTVAAKAVYRFILVNAGVFDSRAADAKWHGEES